MISSQGVIAVGAAAACTQLFLTVVSIAIPEPKPIDVHSIETDAANRTVNLFRTVNSDEILRSGIFIELVDIETERSVPGCENVTRSDFGPDEPRLQPFPFDAFFTPDCAGALEIGKKYVPIMVLTPAALPPTQKRGEPFVWADERGSTKGVKNDLPR